MRCMHAACVLYVRGMHAACAARALHVRCVCAASALRVRCVCTARVHCVCALRVRCVYAARAVRVRCVCALPLPAAPQVVEALRICYIDFKPLRVAGDLIFKVIGEVVERRAKARTSDPEIPEAEAA